MRATDPDPSPSGRAPGAFFAVDGETFVPTDATLGPWGPGLLHGGPVAALFTAALERIGDPSYVSTRLTVEFFRPVRQEPLVVATRTVRTGRRVQLLEAELSAAGRPVARSTLLRVSRARVEPPEGMRQADGRPPDDPARSHPYGVASTVSGAMIIGTGVEMRVPHPRRDTGGSGVVWMRSLVPIVAGASTSPMAAVALVADFGNGVSAPVAVCWPPPVSFVSADLDVRLLRPPVGEWLRVASRSTWTADGVGLTTSEIGDSEGPLATAAQTLVLQPVAA